MRDLGKGENQGIKGKYIIETKKIILILTYS